MKEPILITGCARSGTSMTAAIVHLCGAWKGDTGGPNRYNEKGMFENLGIRQNVVKPYLRMVNADPLAQYPLPDINNMPIPEDTREIVIDIMKSQGLQDSEWMYKGAKMSLIWPVWDYAFPTSKWIIVRRRKHDIVNSCIRTGFMKAYRRPQVFLKVGAKNEAEGWLWWVEQHLKRFEEMKEAGLLMKEVWPEKMVNNDYSEIKEVIEWVGLKFNEDKAREFIEPKLWKAKR